MFLKKIELNGFKSFANKTEFAINKGITAVVGPNGSGKSNIIDGIRWVLGEQSAKTLRGAKMEDVIFAGSDSKRQKNYAEVSLIFDNSERKLNLDYSEVAITRRIFRDGESEYSINKTNCRLKDINELFMDTGVGKEAYSIISQGQVEEILNSRPEEKRMIFEEAAGIVKFKNKKKDSLKKLEETQQNLTRVDDILLQQEQDLPTVKEQAQKATEYKNIKEKLKELDVSLILGKIENIEKQYKESERNINIYKAQQNDVLRAYHLTEAQHEEVLKETKEAEEKINQVRNEEITLLKNIEEVKYTIQLNAQQIDDSKKRMESMKFQCAEIENEISGNNQQHEKVTRKTIEIQTGLKSEKELLHIEENRVAELIKEIDGQKLDIDKLKEKIIGILNTSATIKNEIKNLQANATKIELNIVKKQKEEEVLIDRKVIIQDKLERLNNEILDIDMCSKEIENTLYELMGSIDNLASEITVKKDFKDKKLTMLNELGSKIKALEHLESSFAGYNIGPKEVLKQYQTNAKLKGSIAQLIKVPEHLTNAIEVALGGNLQNIVVEDGEFASQIIEYLKTNKLGRATFLPLKTIKGNSMAPPLNESLKGVIGVASDLINYESTYNEIMNFLLGRIIIVDTLKNGLLLAKSTGFKYRIVSLDGDVVNAGGAITGGKYSTKSSGLLQRGMEINQLKANYCTYETEVDKLMKDLLETEEKHKDMGDKVKVNKDALGQLKGKSNELKQQVLLGKQEAKGILEHIQLLDKEKHFLNNELINSSENLSQNNTLLELNNEQQNIISTQISQLNKENISKIDDYDSLKAKTVSKQITIASLEQEYYSLKKQKVMIQDTQKSNINKLNNNLVLIETLDSSIKEKEIINQSARSKHLELEERKIMQNQRQRKYEAIKYQLQEKYDTSRVKLKELTQSKEHLITKINSTNLKKSKLLLELDGCTEKLLSDYFLTITEAKEICDTVEDINERDCQKQVNILREDLRGIGEVNLGAIEEYNRVLSKMDFLQRQKDDLNKAKLDLKKIIFEMDKQMAIQFEQSFEKIKENFSEVFQKLFSGGRGYLRLTEPDNVLESGIEIFAQPPGKKLQSMMLLSGGEKALTAIALLFAILKTKPSPFCVLDEIEAALDEANVERFAAYLKEMAKESQFIVVTHRKGTMESADILYGITMEEYGISKEISVNLTIEDKNNKKVG